MATARKRKTPRRSSPSADPARGDAGLGEHKNAVALLKADHREVEALFTEFKKNGSSTHKLQLARNICAALRVHTTIEEEIFYPAFLAATGAEDIHDEAQVEHAGAKNLIIQIENAKPGDQLFDAQVKVLSEMIKHHVKEEERFGGMFSKARRSKLDLDALGTQLQARKSVLLTTPAKRALGKAGATPQAVIAKAAMNDKRRAARSTSASR
jgi:hemerythrin superfamily protein